MRLNKTSIVIVLVIVLFQTIPLVDDTPVAIEKVRVPVLIRQGPLGLAQQASSQYYWYQVGAIGDSSSSNFIGANVTIRTVYDQLNDDAHSYWVGGHLSNGAFLQVGYLNGLTTTGRPYCCAWFYEYFPAGQTNVPPGEKCCPPVVGLEGSAGPVGSWHNYSMVHTGNSVWSFYMDGNFLNSTSLGATSSGQNSPAAIAEVAQAASNGDILGPGEFKDMWFQNLSGNWIGVPAANNLIWYGEGTASNRPSNPYGVQEVNGVANDFLAGSEIPQLSSPAPPPGGPQLWGPTVTYPPIQLSVTILDTSQQQFIPEWMSFKRSTTSRFYTDSQSYRSLRIENGFWSVDKVMWHSVNIVGQSSSVTVLGASNLTIRTTVSSLRIRVVGTLFSLPVNRATVITFLPDTTNASAKTDVTGSAVLQLLPPGRYYLRVTVPYGVPAVSSQVVPAGEATVRVLGLAEMLTIIIIPIFLAILAAILAVRKERQRAGSMPSFPTALSVAGICSKCGTPLHMGDLFCPNCGTSVRPPAQLSTASEPEKGPVGAGSNTVPGDSGRM